VGRRHRLQSSGEGFQEGVQGRRLARRLEGHRLHRGEDVLDAVVELGDQGLALAFRRLAIGDLLDHAQEPHDLARGVAHRRAGAEQPDHRAVAGANGAMFDLVGLARRHGAQHRPSDARQVVSENVAEQPFATLGGYHPGLAAECVGDAGREIDGVVRNVPGDGAHAGRAHSQIEPGAFAVQPRRRRAGGRLGVQAWRLESHRANVAHWTQAR